MMDKRFLISWLAVFVAWMLGDLAVHGILLKADYAALPNLFRPESEAQQYFGLMVLAHVMLAGALVWIYSRGAEAKPWLQQGVRFGVAVALLTTVPFYMIYYVVQPMPVGTVVKQVVLASILDVLLGMVAAFMYRVRPAVAAA